MLCSDQTNKLERAWEMCALCGVILWYAYERDGNFRCIRWGNLVIMSSSERKVGLICSKLTYFRSTSCYSS
jgi:hypothetical protein